LDSILQIAAISTKGSFDTFVMPEGKIPPSATAVHGITKVGLQLRHNGVEVEWKRGGEALDSFLKYLEGHGAEVVLVAHNLQFDLSFLYYSVQREKLETRFKNIVQGGICTLAMGRAAFPKDSVVKPSDLKLGSLVDHFYGESLQFSAHDARGDVEALQKCYDKLQELTHPEKSSCTTGFFFLRRSVASKFDSLQVLSQKDNSIKKPILEVCFSINTIRQFYLFL
jgi:DNA polymerase III epsilon subunit-like protein